MEKGVLLLILGLVGAIANPTTQRTVENTSSATVTLKEISNTDQIKSEEIAPDEKILFEVISELETANGAEDGQNVFIDIVEDESVLSEPEQMDGESFSNFKLSRVDDEIMDTAEAAVFPIFKRRKHHQRPRRRFGVRRRLHKNKPYRRTHFFLPYLIPYVRPSSLPLYSY